VSPKTFQARVRALLTSSSMSSGETASGRASSDMVRVGPEHASRKPQVLVAGPALFSGLAKLPWVRRFFFFFFFSRFSSQMSRGRGHEGRTGIHGFVVLVQFWQETLLIFAVRRLLHASNSPRLVIHGHALSTTQDSQQSPTAARLRLSTEAASTRVAVKDKRALSPATAPTISSSAASLGGAHSPRETASTPP
jgi:hypothetical protein